MHKTLTKVGTLSYIPTSTNRYNPESNWQQAQVKLLPNAVVEITGPTVEPKTIHLGPAITATKSTVVNFPGVFVLNTEAESEYSSGPLFASPDPREAGAWMRTLNYARFCRAADNQHPHPLTFYMPQYFSQYQQAPRSAVKTYHGSYTCSHCQTNVESNFGGICEFCDFKLCGTCQQGFKTISEISRVKSPHHNHDLLHFDKAQGEEWFESGYNGSYICDICKQPNDGGVYHCPICSYDECEKCASGHSQAKQPASASNEPMRLNLGVFQDYFIEAKDDSLVFRTVGHFTPQHGSVITNKAWDLHNIENEPVPHAYCEFTFKSFADKVAVGIGNTIFEQNQMLGYQQNSMSYFSDGSISRNNHEHHDKYLPTFKGGDTIGVGVLYDSFNQRRLFFTKNGKMLDLFPYNVHKGMDVFPGVGFTSVSGVSFTSNFQGPYMFDPKSIPNHRNDKVNRLDAIPSELVVTCLSYVATDTSSALQLRQVSKKFAELSLHNNIWRHLFCQRWTRQNPNLKMKSWFTLFKRRYAIDNYKDDYSMPFEVAPVKLIENCDFDFLCPLKWENLPESNNPSERHCDKCNKTVYRVDDEDTLRKYSQQGKCVSMFKLPDPNDPFGLAGFQPRMMGMPPAMPRLIPMPFANMQLPMDLDPTAHIMNKHILVALLLALAFSVAVARSIKPVNVIDRANEDQDEEYTITIRRSDPKEATSGNLYHRYEEYMKNLEEAMKKKVEERSIKGDDPIDWQKIVNIGKEIWDVVVRNQPTIDSKNMSSATIVPSGINDWRQLTSWKGPVTNSYTVEYKNMIGLTVISFQFQVVFIPGGKYQGRGRFLHGVTVIPTNIDVTWSYHFNVNVDVPTIWNAGETSEDPLAAAQINLHLDFNGKKKQVIAWHVMGDGSIQKLN